MHEYLIIMLFIVSTALTVVGSNIQVNQREEHKYKYGLNKKQIIIVVSIMLLSAIIVVVSKDWIRTNMWNWFVLWSIYLAVVAAMVYDSQLKIIPNYIIILLVLAKLGISLAQYIYAKSSLVEIGISCIIAIVCILVLAIVSVITYNGIGMGDIKLLAAIGFTGGVTVIWSTLLFALVICTIVTVICLIGRKKTMQDSLPFAPFIMGGYVVAFIIYII